MSSAETPDSERRTMLRFAAMGLAAPLLGCSGSERKATAPSSTPRWRRFDNKVVLITGATSGIGRAAAFQFAAEGGKVGFCGRRQYPGLEVEQQIKAGGGKATYQESAAFALVLASDDHPYMTGAQMVIDGGKTAHAG